MNLRVRKVVEEDWEILLEWVNDPITRKKSFSSRLISVKEHQRWLNSILENPQILFYILENSENIPVSQVRIDENGEISIAVSPLQRGKGYGTESLVCVIDYLQKQGFNKKIIAHIKEDNPASSKIFEKAGFVFQGLVEYKNGICQEWWLKK